MSHDTRGHDTGAKPALPRRRSPRVLDVASGLCVVTAGLLWLWPVSRKAGDAAASGGAQQTNAPTLAPSVAPSAALPFGAVTDSLQAAVVNSNVFSATRRAPTSRFVVPGQAAAMDVYSTATEASAQPDSASASLPQLSGIVSERGQRQALLQLLASDGGPRLYREGDVHAGYRIVRIGVDYVLLTSRAGTRTVRLSPRESPDSLEMTP